MSGERRLWSEVLLRVAQDLCVTDKGTRIEAENWIGTRPSRRFAAVASLAGVEPQRTHEWLAGLCALNIKDRRRRVVSRSHWAA